MNINHNSQSGGCNSLRWFSPNREAKTTTDQATAKAEQKERNAKMNNKVYEMVTDRIINELEKGNIPWQKPWTGRLDGAFNRVSKKSYSILNQMLLSKQGEYATFKQWQDLGGKIKKGAKSEIVVFWKIMQYKEQVQNEKGETETKTKNVPLLKYYNVFHIDDVEGVEPLKEERTGIESDKTADEIMNGYLSRERIKVYNMDKNRAYYSPMLDYINLPEMDQFGTTEEYYSTAFHEMTHSTGHENRLNRLDSSIAAAAFGSESYSKEELIAEIGAATLVNYAGLESEKSFRNSAAYIQSWLRALKNDTKMIVSAAGKADKAVAYILGIETE